MEVAPQSNFITHSPSNGVGSDVAFGVQLETTIIKMQAPPTAQIRARKEGIGWVYRGRFIGPPYISVIFTASVSRGIAYSR